MEASTAGEGMAAVGVAAVGVAAAASDLASAAWTELASTLADATVLSTGRRLRPVTGGHRVERERGAFQPVAGRVGGGQLRCGVDRDGVLVARHENEISATTDIANYTKFADRHTTKTVDGAHLTDWFTEDFTLAELQDTARG